MYIATMSYPRNPEQPMESAEGETRELAKQAVIAQSATNVSRWLTVYDATDGRVIQCTPIRPRINYATV